VYGSLDRILIEQDVEYLRCVIVCGNNRRFGSSPRENYGVSIMLFNSVITSNFQYGWNGFNIGYAVVAASVNKTC
jgi:hypothetical protein